MAIQLYKRIKLTFTQRQYDELEARAKAVGVDISNLVRSWLFPLSDHHSALYEGRMHFQYPLVGVSGPKRCCFVRLDKVLYHMVSVRADSEHLPVAAWIREFFEQYILHSERYLKINGKIVHGGNDAWVTSREEHIRRDQKNFRDSIIQDVEDGLTAESFMQGVFADELNARARLALPGPERKMQPGEERRRTIRLAIDEIVAVWVQQYPVLQAEGSLNLIRYMLDQQGSDLERVLAAHVRVGTAEGWFNRKRFVQLVGVDRAKKAKTRSSKKPGRTANP